MTYDYDKHLTIAYEESQGAARGCCIGLLLSIPVWFCIVVFFIKVL